MYAIVEVGGMQWKVEEAKTIKVPKLDIEPGKSLEISDVLMVVDGGQVSVGQPFVDNAKVTATVVDHGKAKKVVIFKKKRRKGYQVLRGHRQPFTQLKIDGIVLGKAPAKKAETAEASVAEAAPAADKPKAAPKKAPVKKAAAEGAAPKKAPAKKETAGAAAPKKAAAKTKASDETKPKAAPKKKAPAKTAEASEEGKEG